MTESEMVEHEAPDLEGAIRAAARRSAKRADDAARSEARLRADHEALQRTAGDLESELARVRRDLVALRARRHSRAVAAVEAARKEGLGPVATARAVLGELRRPSELPAGVRSDRSNESDGRELLEAGRAAQVEGRYEDALAAAEGVLDATPSHLRALRQRRDAQVKLGDLRGLLDTTGRLRRVRDDRRLRLTQEQVAGRLRELDTTWLPTVAPLGPAPAPTGRLRVLHVLKESAPHLTNGYTMRSRYTVVSQRDAGMDPHVVTSLGFPRSAGVAEPEASEDVEGVVHHRLDLGPSYPYRSMPLDRLLDDTALLVQRLARDLRPDVIQAGSGFRGYETALVGLAVARDLGVPFVYEVRSFLEQTWTPDPHMAERGELYHLRDRQEVRCMQAADLVITIGHAMRADLVARGIPAEKVAVVPNGVDPSSFEPAAPDASLARELGVHGRAVLGYVSNLGQREGHDVLLRAIARLRAGGRDVVGLLVGGGPQADELHRLAEELGIAEHVRFTGRVPHDRVADYYRLIDVFVIPRHDDRAARLVTPLKPFEALALGRTLLVSDLPALTEIVEPGVRGLSFRLDDDADLAAQAARLLDDRGLGRRLADEGRRWVIEERDWAMNGPRYRDLLQPLVDGRRPDVRAGVAGEREDPS